MHFTHTALGDVDGGVFAASRYWTIGAKVFSDGREGVGRGEIEPLEASDLGLRRTRADPGSSPGPSTPRPQRGSRAISSIGAKVMLTPSQLASRAASRAVSSQISRIEHGGFGQHHRKRGAVAVDDVEPYE